MDDKSILFINGLEKVFMIRRKKMKSIIPFLLLIILYGCTYQVSDTGTNGNAKKIVNNGINTNDRFQRFNGTRDQMDTRDLMNRSNFMDNPRFNMTSEERARIMIERKPACDGKEAGDSCSITRPARPRERSIDDNRAPDDRNIQGSCQDLNNSLSCQMGRGL
jgi:hypothetical protein